MPQAVQIKLIAALVIGIIIGAAIGFIAAPTVGAGGGGGGGKGLPKEIPIGVLIDISGPLMSTGKRIERALALAQEDINAYAAKLGYDVKFKFLIEDTGVNPERALSRLQTLAARGVKVVIGPLASSEVKAIKSFADSNKIVIVSPSSTAPSLAIPGDYIFRFVPTDKFQGRALARVIKSRGYDKVAVIYRGDTWGEGLYLAFKDSFESMGGKVVGAIKYDPNAKDLSAEVARLSDVVRSAGSKTAVLVISFDNDGVMILSSARGDPVLSKTEWFGTDGTAYMEKIAAQVGDFAAAVGGLKSTIFAAAESKKFEDFVKRFESKFGEKPDTYTCNAYDAAWVIALTILQVGEYDGEKIAKALPDVASRYFGVTGWTLLDENGDRAGGDYEVAAIVSEGGKYVWKPVGRYVFTSDSVEWIKG